MDCLCNFYDPTMGFTGTPTRVILCFLGFDEHDTVSDNSSIPAALMETQLSGTNRQFVLRRAQSTMVSVSTASPPPKLSPNVVACNAPPVVMEPASFDTDASKTSAFTAANSTTLLTRRKTSREVSAF